MFLFIIDAWHSYVIIHPVFFFLAQQQKMVVLVKAMKQEAVIPQSPFVPGNPRQLPAAQADS